MRTFCVLRLVLTSLFSLFGDIDEDAPGQDFFFDFCGVFVPRFFYRWGCGIWQNFSGAVVKKSTWTRFALATLSAVIFVVTANLLFPPKDPRVSSGPSVPENVAITGTASPISTSDAKMIWFRKPVNGEYDVRLKSFPFSPVFAKQRDDTFLFLDGSTLLAYTPTGEFPITIFPGKTLPMTVEDITVSRSGTSTIISSSDGNSGIFLTTENGEWTSTPTRAGPVTSLIVGKFVTDHGTALVATKGVGDSDGEVCIQHIKIGIHEETSCVSIESNVEFVEFRDDGQSAFVFGFYDGIPQCTLLSKEAENWIVSDQQFVSELSELDTDSIDFHSSFGGRISVLTSSHLLVSFPYPSQDCSVKDVEITSLSSLVGGPTISITNDHELVNVVFYQERDVTAGQYVVSFNMLSPQKHVGPWQIPPEVLWTTGYDSHQKVDTLFLEGDPIEQIREQ